MNEERAIEVLGNRDGIYVLFVSDFKEVILDGTFTKEQIEAILWRMENGYA